MTMPKQLFVRIQQKMWANETEILEWYLIATRRISLLFVTKWHQKIKIPIQK